MERRVVAWAAVAVALFLSPAPARADGPAPAAPPTQPQPAAPKATAPPPRIEFTSESRIEKGDGNEIYFYRTNYVSPKELIQTAQTLLQIPGVAFKDFPRQNEVILEGTREAIETALDAFAYFDVPEPQVFVESKIVEITYDSNFEFGLSSLMDRDKAGPNTIFRGETVTLNPPSFFQSQQPGNLPFQGVGLSFGFVGKLAEEFGAFDLTLQALQRNGTAEVLSKPSIVATQGQQASVKTAQKTPVLQIRNATSNPGGETLNVETSYVETKIELVVKPTFIGDGFLTLDLQPTVSGVTGFSVGPGGTSAPIISSRDAKTLVTMADGETLIIGGLYTKSTIQDKAKVPLLSQIPVLGKLFERTRDQEVKTELVFFVTPHILRKRTDYKVIVPPGEKQRLGESPGGAVPCPPPARPVR